MTDRAYGCPNCGSRRHSFSGRKTRLLLLPPVGRKRCLLDLVLHRLCCGWCGYTWWPRLSFMSGSKRYSFALTAMDLLQFGTIQAVAKYLQVGWDMVKEIHKSRLQTRYRVPRLKDLAYLSIDEFSIRKGHTYMTIFVDRLKAVAIDMSHSYRKAVQEHLPSVDIVYDHYHISAMINRAIVDLRRQEHHHAENEQKQVMQGSRFLLLRNYETLGADSQERLQSLLEVNQPLLTMYTMKEQLRAFWKLPNRKDASSFLYTWCFDAMDSGVKKLVKIGLTLTRYRNGILNYFSHPITNAS